MAFGRQNLYAYIEDATQQTVRLILYNLDVIFPCFGCTEWT